MTFARILFVMVITAGTVVFGAQNWDNVPVNLIFGAPTHVRLVFLLVIAAAIGYVTAVVRNFGRELRLRAEVRQLRRQVRSLETSRPIETTAAELNPEEPSEELVECTNGRV